MKESHEIILLVMVFIPIFIVFGALVWGMSMLTDSYERKWQLEDKIRAWQAREPIRNMLFDGASKAGFTNSDLIYNTTKLCWYKSETNQFYGECDEERPRIQKIIEDSVNQPKYTWQSITNGSETL